MDKNKINKNKCYYELSYGMLVKNIISTSRFVAGIFARLHLVTKEILFVMVTVM